MPSGDVVRFDFRWMLEKGKITDFAINVALVEGERTEDVYRVDTKHGYLHEQRFWMSPKPKKLDLVNYNVAFKSKKEEVFENCEKWIKLFKEAEKKR